jgi:hypothetical protein
MIGTRIVVDLGSGMKILPGKTDPAKTAGFVPFERLC